MPVYVYESLNSSFFDKGFNFLHFQKSAKNLKHLEILSNDDDLIPIIS